MEVPPSQPRTPEPPMLKPDSRIRRVAELTERKLQLEVELLELQVAQARTDESPLLELVRDFVDSNPCGYDHHGYCQEHGWFETEPTCPNQRARNLGLVDEAG